MHARLFEILELGRRRCLHAAPTLGSAGEAIKGADRFSDIVVVKGEALLKNKRNAVSDIHQENQPERTINDRLHEMIACRYESYLGTHDAADLIDAGTQDLGLLQSQGANGNGNLAAFAFGFVGDHAASETLLANGEAVFADAAETLRGSFAEANEIRKVASFVATDASAEQERGHDEICVFW